MLDRIKYRNIEVVHYYLEESKNRFLRESLVAIVSMIAHVVLSLFLIFIPTAIIKIPLLVRIPGVILILFLCFPLYVDYYRYQYLPCHISLKQLNQTSEGEIKIINDAYLKAKDDKSVIGGILFADHHLIAPCAFVKYSDIREIECWSGEWLNKKRDNARRGAYFSDRPLNHYLIIHEQTFSKNVQVAVELPKRIESDEISVIVEEIKRHCGEKIPVTGININEPRFL